MSSTRAQAKLNARRAIKRKKDEQKAAAAVAQSVSQPNMQVKAVPWLVRHTLMQQRAAANA